MNAKRVSVIIPCHDHRAELALCIAALAGQDYPRNLLEIIVVNNKAGEPLKPDHHGLDIICVDEFAEGSYAARNRGIREASGEILLFTDADCMPRPDWVSAIVAFMHGTGSRVAGGNIELRYRHADGPRTVTELHESLFGMRQAEYVQRNGWSMTANLAVMREVFDEFGPFDQRLYSGGDKEFGRRLKRAGQKIAFCREAAVLHPARSEPEQLLAKRRRIAGGKLAGKQRKYGKVYCVAYLAFNAVAFALPVNGKVLKALTSGLSLLQKAGILLLLKRIEWEELVEQYQILAGKTAKRT